jgi:hypothetical protein
MAGLDPSPPGGPKAKCSGSAPASEDRARRRAGALRSWTESGRPPYWPRGPAACTIDLDFLGPSRFCPGKPRKQGLDFLGFPWILSSESILFNGLRGFCRKKISSALLPPGDAAGGRSRHLTMQKCSMAHRASLTHFCFSAINCRRQKLSILCRAPGRALSRIIDDNQLHFTQSPTRRKSLNLGVESGVTVIRGVA